jgi:hypothetical protein
VLLELMSEFGHQADQRDMVRRRQQLTLRGHSDKPERKPKITERRFAEGVGASEEAKESGYQGATKADSLGARFSVRVGTRLKRTRRGDIVFGRSGVLALYGKLRDNPC